MRIRPSIRWRAAERSAVLLCVAVLYAASLSGCSRTHIHRFDAEGFGGGCTAP